MTNKEFILELIRLIRPKYYNKLTWALVLSGIGLIAPSLITILLHIFIKSVSEFNLIGEYDILWGLLLIIIGLVFNILSQIINGSSSIQLNFIFNKGGNLTVNQPTIFVTDQAKADEIAKALSKFNQNNSINYSKSEFTLNFAELFKGFPWIKNIAIEKIEDNLEYFRIDFETSNSIAEFFYCNIYNISGDKLKIESMPPIDLNSISNLTFIYWEIWGYWTLNSYETFTSNTLSFEEAIKSDISNIIGDLTFIISELEIKLTYDKGKSDSKAISHPEYGDLQKVELLSEGNLSELNFIELGLIDSLIDMQVTAVEQQQNISVVTESISYLHLFKLSTLMIRFLQKSRLQYDFKNSLTIRKFIIEFTKKIKADKSYAIPSDTSKQVDNMFKKAFGNSWVYKQYEKRK